MEEMSKSLNNNNNNNNEMGKSIFLTPPDLANNLNNSNNNALNNSQQQHNQQNIHIQPPPMPLITPHFTLPFSSFAANLSAHLPTLPQASRPNKFDANNIKRPTLFEDSRLMQQFSSLNHTNIKLTGQS